MFQKKLNLTPLGQGLPKSRGCDAVQKINSPPANVWSRLVLVPCRWHRLPAEGCWIWPPWALGAICSPNPPAWQKGACTSRYFQKLSKFLFNLLCSLRSRLQMSCAAEETANKYFLQLFSSLGCDIIPKSPGPSPLSLLAAPSSAAGKRALLGCLGLTVKKMGSSPRHWTHVCGPSINFGTGELQHKPAWGEDTVALYRTREWMPGIPGKLGCYLCQVKLQLAMRWQCLQAHPQSIHAVVITRSPGICWQSNVWGWGRGDASCSHLGLAFRQDVANSEDNESHCSN